MKKQLTLFLSLLLPGYLFPQVLTVPVVVHVIWNNASQNITDAQVISQIDVLNEDYGRTNSDTVNTPAGFLSLAANTEIQFCLAQTDPNGLPTTGIIHKQTTQTSFLTDDKVKHTSTGGEDAWDVTRYFNIWVCNLSSGVIGYAEFPTASASNTFGVVIHYQFFGRTGNVTAPYNKGRSCTHTLAHCFNLYNLNADASCQDIDSVPDTPTPSSNVFGCSTYPLLDACNPTAPGVMFMNFMSYADDSCMNLFTQGQKARMRQLLSSSPYYALTNSTVCLPLGTQEIAEIPALQIYPNPAEESVTVKVSGPTATERKIQIRSLDGKEIITKSLPQSTNQIEIDLKKMEPGMYLISVGGSTTKLFITQKKSLR